jgi:spore coat protein CotH
MKLAALILLGCSVACATPDDPAARQDELFDPDVVQDIQLDMTAADLATLEASATTMGDFPYVTATFRYKDVTLENVGVRYKGNSSRIPGTMAKRSYLIKFDEFVDGQKLFDLKRLGLDNGFQFGSLFSERILNEILAAEGVPAIRTTYARLTINGVYKGVYVELERIDKKFITRNFDDNDGNLYKCDEGGPGANLSYLGDAASSYVMGTRPTFEAETNEETADTTDLIAVIRAIDKGTLTDLDTDMFTKTMAIMMLGGAFDQLTGFNAHNYYLYSDPSTKKWTYIAHDLDVGFADHAFDSPMTPGGIQVIDGWNAKTPQPLKPMPLVDKVLADATLAQQYRDHAKDYLDRYFAPAILNARLDALYAQIATDLATDPYPNSRIVVPSVVGYPAIVADLKAFVQRRYDTARSQLGAP